MKQNGGNSQLLCFLLPLWYNPGKVVINMDTKETNKIFFSMPMWLMEKWSVCGRMTAPDDAAC